MKKYINLNVLLAEYIVNSLYQLGVRDVIVSPGSRSTPLVTVLSSRKNIRKHVVIDERSNGYFALGISGASKKPVAIVTTSGTAVAELYPAVIEAYHQRIPLIICSADRPEYLVNTGANQTINQKHLFGIFTKYFIDSGNPNPTRKYFNKINSELSEAFYNRLKYDPGPVHINLRFEKPLEKSASTHSVSKEFYSYVREMKLNKNKDIKVHKDKFPASLIKEGTKRLIMIGPANLAKSDLVYILKISKQLNALIIADGLSGMRLMGKPVENMLVNATAFIRNRDFLKSLDADLIIQFGNAPTSNILLNFFKLSKAKKILVDKFGDIKDPSGTHSSLLRITIEDFYKQLSSVKIQPADGSWISTLKDLNSKAQHIKTNIINHSEFPSEPGLIKSLLDAVPAKSNLMVSNSIVPRDVDYFADQYGKDIKTFHNRGTSGIDGIISTAAGIQAASRNQTFLLIGDLAFMHDLNGLWLLKRYKLPLNIILINNGGGSIFEMLPVVKEKIEFEKYFKVPPGMDFKNITESFGGIYKEIKEKKQLRQSLTRNIKSFEVLELKTDSGKSLDIRKEYWNTVIDETQKVIDGYPHK